MIMKWEDLEPGDIVKVTKNFSKFFPGANWVNRNLVVARAKVWDYNGHNYIDINVYCEDKSFYNFNFQIDENGYCRYYEDCGILFDIIELKKE